jgi:hypothetical protein
MNTRSHAGGEKLGVGESSGGCVTDTSLQANEQAQLQTRLIKAPKEPAQSVTAIVSCRATLDRSLEELAVLAAEPGDPLDSQRITCPESDFICAWWKPQRLKARRRHPNRDRQGATLGCWSRCITTSRLLRRYERTTRGPCLTQISDDVRPCYG